MTHLEVFATYFVMIVIYYCTYYNIHTAKLLFTFNSFEFSVQSAHRGTSSDATLASGTWHIIIQSTVVVWPPLLSLHLYTQQPVLVGVRVDILTVGHGVVRVAGISLCIRGVTPFQFPAIALLRKPTCTARFTIW